MKRRKFTTVIAAGIAALGLIKSIPDKVKSITTIDLTDISPKIAKPRCQETFTYAGPYGKYIIAVAYQEDLSTEIHVENPDGTSFVHNSFKSYEDEDRKCLYDVLTCDYNMDEDVARAFVTHHRWTEWYEFGGPVEPDLMAAYYNPRATLITHERRYGKKMIWV